jgi:catechol 2,3-dioxygenase-like lactoylglutathione lyase family enzyme
MSLGDCEVGPAMAVSDMDAAKEFYEGKLGLSPVKDTPDEVPRQYRCGKGTGITVYLSPDHAGKSTATLAGWVVDDLGAMVDELAARGVSFEQYDEEALKTDERGIASFDEGKVAFFRDPDGNTHALNQGM